MKKTVLFIGFIVAIFSLHAELTLSQAKGCSVRIKREKSVIKDSKIILGEHHYRDIYPDTWVGIDALGRTMPNYSEVGPIKKDHRRIVGIFYITWHRDELYNLKSPYKADVSKILASDPNARLDGKNPAWGTYSSYHWGEPEMGYFLSKDEYVIRHDMSMLADAGVDVVIMDVTNAVEYWSEWNVIFSVMEKRKQREIKFRSFVFGHSTVL